MALSTFDLDASADGWFGALAQGEGWFRQELLDQPSGTPTWAISSKNGVAMGAIAAMSGVPLGSIQAVNGVLL